MTTLRELLLVLAGVFAILVITALIVVGLAEKIMPPPERQQSPTAINFRAACEAAKGNAVWNGRHWECLK